MKYITFLIISLLHLNVSGQIKWNTINDTTALNPVVIDSYGAIKIKGVAFDGRVIVDFSQKEIFYNDGEYTHKIDRKDAQDISFDNLGSFYGNEIFNKEIEDSLHKLYRAKIYPLLDLNEIVFSTANNDYLIEHNKLTIRNKSVLNGKLCMVTPTAALILEFNGQLLELTNSNFRFLEFNNHRFFNISSLYSFLYQDYNTQLSKIIDLWINRIKEAGISNLLKNLGPIDKVLPFGNNQRLYVWESPYQQYEINIQSHTNILLDRFGSITAFSNGNSFGNSLLLNNIPSIFYNRNFYSNSFSISTTNSSGSYTGRISSTDNTIKFSVLVDLNNTILEVYQKNLFLAYPYGGMFKFIKYQ